jgi:hypothetical protein
MQTTVISPYPLFIDNIAKGFIYFVNNWFSTELVNMLLLIHTSRSVKRNVTTT